MEGYKAGIYLRISKQNKEENNSIEAQKEITKRYAKKNGIKIVKEYEDNGYSGITDKRPGIEEMIKDIKKGQINMVIVKDTSRLTRNKNKTGWYTEIFFPDNDIRYISVTENIDSGKRYEIDDTIMLRGIANQYYLTDILKKVKSNKKVMKEKGKYVEAQVPYGYKLSEQDKHKVIIDEDVAENIKIIYNMYSNGKTGKQIAEYLNSSKIETPSKYLKMKKSSEKWNPETITDILSNIFYTGDTIQNKYITDYMKKTCKKNTDKKTWIIKNNTHDSIITKEQYQKVQEIKEKKRSNKKNKYEYLLKDLLYCGNCNHKLQYKTTKTKNNYFICNIVYKDNEKCNNKTTINEKNLNEIIINKIQKKINQNDIKKLILENYEKNNTYKKSLEKIKRLERKKKLIYQKKCENKITEVEFKREYVKIKKQIESQQKDCKRELELNKLREQKLKDVFEGKNIENELIKNIIEKIKINLNNQIEIIFKI